MALNYVFIGFILIGFVTALCRFFFLGDLDIFTAIIQGTFDNATAGFTLSIGLTGALTLWMGIMKIGEDGKAVRLLSKLVAPFFNKLFPEVPKDHKVFGTIMMNYSANMLGLDNAATPMGLKAMGELQELNPKKDTASNAQIMFLVLNTSGLTLIPVSILALRTQHFVMQGDKLGATGFGSNPADVFIPILIATFVSTLVGIIAVSIKQKINLLQPVVIAYLGGAAALIGLTIWYFSALTPEEVKMQSGIIASFTLFTIIAGFVALAFKNKVNVYESFIEGAKGGFSTAIKIIPYLIGILMAIGIFRTCGAMDFLLDGIKWIFVSGAELFNVTSQVDLRFVDALPTAIMKPLSGGGARGTMVEAMMNFPMKLVDGKAVESFPSFLSGVFQGSTETTFYVLAVYFGSVGIKKTRYAIGAGLIADFAGILAAIFIAYLFYTH